MNPETSPQPSTAPAPFGNNVHTGKIGRLPRSIRQEVNHRLDKGESAPEILEWLNALPVVQAVLTASFNGNPVNEQNLTNWRQGGYQEWLRQQERRALASALSADARELAADVSGTELSTHLSTLLVADFAASVQHSLGAVADPAELCQQQQEFLLTLSRVRRQDYLAARLAIDRERREQQRLREQQKNQYERDLAATLAPLKAVLGSSMPKL